MDMVKTNSCVDDLNTLSSSSSSSKIHRNDRNVLLLLARREIAPRISKSLPRRQWGETSKQNHQSPVKPKSEIARDSRRELHSWVEAESLRGLSAKYCSLEPSPRSTIAAAFSSDGKILASTHGDHTVKIIDCQTGKCEKVLSGHRRTPWVVRFHPLRPEILASGSLDHEVRLWNANTSECIGSRDFYRPIASIAFHSEGELLAVAAGHKLYLWQYNSKGETSPTIVLRTRRSLRAVHFHPHAAPFLLTAEVNDLDSSDSTMAAATSLGYLHYPPPAVYMGNVSPIDRIVSRPVEPSSPGQLVFLENATEEHEQPMTSSSSIPISNTNNTVNDNLASQNQNPCEMQISPYGNSSGTSDLRLPEGYRQNLVTNMDIPSADIGQDPFRDRINWELPFMQGWLMGQSQSGIEGPNLTTFEPEATIANMQFPEVSMLTQNQVNPERPVFQDLSSRATSTSAQEYQQNASINETNDGGEPYPIISRRIQTQLSASLTAPAAAELPCTVKLRIWPHDSENPCASLKAERCRLTIPHAVLCSEMGAHFSPCGRYLAACVACVFPQFEGETGIPTQVHQEVMGGATSPTRHPISARQVMYELRIYSLEKATFGSVLISRPIRAAHCLTSIQFSPTSEHILLAYGRRHSSLLKSIVINGETSISIYTVLEVYRVSDMKLVSVLPSAEDEVNVACFHPLAGGGLVYGTKEGKLRVLQYNGASGMNVTSKSDHIFEAHMVEVQTYALEC